MPNRILRDWTDSFAVDLLSPGAEIFFVRLIMKVDDFGRFSADPRLLKANLFPLKADLRETDIARWLTECEDSGVIVIYKVAIKTFLQITNFNQRLRQKKEKYPPPPFSQSPTICQSNDGRTSVNSKSMDGLKRREEKRSRNEDEVEPEEKISSPSATFSDSDLIKNIDNLAKDAFEDKVYFVEHIQRKFQLTPEAVKTSLMNFNEHLRSLGEMIKSKRDYRTHFQNWLRKQPVAVQPKKMKTI